MPSPFPGMDPFLEHPDFFPDLHGRLHVHLSEALQRVLPAPYFAVVNERLCVETSTRFIEPDTDVIRGGFAAGDDAPIEEMNHGSGGLAVAVAARSQPTVFEVVDEDRRESFVEIRTRRDHEGERIVTTIEVLSLSNKTDGEKGREKYLAKQEEVLRSPTHLVEIDLLRGGVHTTPMSLERMRKKVGKFDYHVSIHRFHQPNRFYVYAWKMADVLPELEIPLLPRDGHVLLDLQAVFTHCYDTGPYQRRVRYDPSRIVPALESDQTEWVIQQLTAKV
jgi:hypothetical protein